MQNDKTTLKDLSFFAPGDAGIFHLLDHTVTQAGREMLRKHVLHPPETFEDLIATQQAVRFFADHSEAWTNTILNGTIVLVEKFFEAADSASEPPQGLTLLFTTFFQRLLNRSAYSFTQFSISHLSDFIRGCRELTALRSLTDLPGQLRQVLDEMNQELERQPLSEQIAAITKKTPFKDLARLSYEARRVLKHMASRLIHYYAKLDAWHALALATIRNNWTFPSLTPSFPICMRATSLYHPLLKAPISYDIEFDENRYFLLLTGANMSGKTTFMRTLGVSALLAHLGMGVPASYFRISFLQGIITNMQVEDNLLLGESYFFAEVQRIKQTAQKLQQPLPHLVLMDELFKGTNVHDAYECTKAVIEGLLQRRRHIMVLSTHLYEVAQQFKDRKDIIFFYFVTDMTGAGNYSFKYELKPGISDDRIGYRILQKAGVIDLLKNGDKNEENKKEE